MFEIRKTYLIKSKIVSEMTQEEMRLDGLFLKFFSHVIHASFLKYKFNDIEFYSVIKLCN